MRKAPLIAATLALATTAVTVGGTAGCNYRPTASRPATEADLPSDFRAKLNLAPEARVVGVTEQSYSKGTKMYLVRYELNGVERAVKYNPKDSVTPNAVFEATPLEPGVLR